MSLPDISRRHFLRGKLNTPLLMQSRRATPQHIAGFDEGKTCIDCHKGIAYKMSDTSHLTKQEIIEFNLEQ